MTPGSHTDVEGSPAGSAAGFLAGGGEMGALMRAHDWSTSPLGPPETWPAPLRTTVRLLLNTGHPMYIYWGPQSACLYNDAYRQSIGPERHPGSLGRPAREVWDEIWDIIGPQIEQVMTGRGATWHENQLVPITRNGRREEVYWTYSYGPIDDETAPYGVGGVLVVCSETTSQVLAERRLAAQSERQRALFEQAPGFVCILRGPEHRFEFVNQAYVRLVGGRDFLGQPVRQVLPEAEGQGFFDWLDSVYRTGERFVAKDLPLRLQRSAGDELEERFVDFIYEPNFDEAGQVIGVFVQGHDVTEAHQAREAERRHRRHLKLLIDELNHRVKNTLAIVQGIAQQSFRGEAADPAARHAFEGRLVALAATYNVLTNARWETSDLRDIITEAVVAHVDGPGRVMLEGPDAPLEPKSAVAIAMAMHELATNATKYGALSTDQGRVSIVWTVDADRQVRLRWREAGGPVVRAPARRGFGSRMIERALAGEVDGAVSLGFEPGGVVCDFRFALPAANTDEAWATDDGLGDEGAGSDDGVDR